MLTTPPLNLFIIYAREDQPALLELKAHLRPLEKRNDLNVWHDAEILPGADWDRDIKAQLATSNIVLLLISKYFFNSEYIEKEELKKALERHSKGEIIVVPVILRHYLWDAHPEISALQVLPKDGKPVYSWRDADEAWIDVARGVQRVIEPLKHRQTEVSVPEKKESEIASAKVEEGRRAFLDKRYEEAFLLLSEFCDTEFDVNLDGYIKLGYLYQNGFGVEQNYNEALWWYRVAANRGSAWGKNNMGWMYENGCGVPKNLTEAAKWYREASGQGLFVAKENLTRLGHSE